MTYAFACDVPVSARDRRPHQAGPGPRAAGRPDRPPGLSRRNWMRDVDVCQSKDAHEALAGNRPHPVVTRTAPGQLRP